MDNKNLKLYKAKLTTLSPVFIGDGESLGKIQTEDEFRQLLETQKELKDKWLNYFLTEKKPSFADFLRHNCNLNPNKKKGDFIKSAGRYYIPGSSIKGAIRTALLSQLIKEGKNKKDAEGFLVSIMKGLRISDSEFIDANNFNFAYVEAKKIIHDKNEKCFDNVPKEFLSAGVTVNFIITIDKQFFKYDFNFIKSALEDFYGKVLEENTNDLNGKSQNKNIPELSDEEKKKQIRELEDKFLKERYGKTMGIPLSKIQLIQAEIRKKYPHLYEGTDTQLIIDNNISVYTNINNLKPNINIGGQAGFNTKVVLRALANDDYEKYLKFKKDKFDSGFTKRHNHTNMPKAPRYLKFTNKTTIGWCHLEAKELQC